MIIGITGKKRSGKTTAAQAFEECGFTQLSFATPLKKTAWMFLSELGFVDAKIAEFEQDKEQLIPIIDVSYRYLLQSLGTEWGRNCVNANLWTLAMRKRLTDLGVEYNDVVIDDVRFDNEAHMIRELGGHIVHLHRMHLDSITDYSFSPDAHASEQGIIFVPGDVHVVNNGDIDDMHIRLVEHLDNWAALA